MLSALLGKVGRVSLLLALWLSLVPASPALAGPTPAIDVYGGQALIEHAISEAVFEETTERTAAAGDGADDAPLSDVHVALVGSRFGLARLGLPPARAPPLSGVSFSFKARAPPLF
jgi:hypothetical protein